MSHLSLSNNNQTNTEVESIWSPDIEQSFLEALAIYPPCGRRKIILPDEGKIYGRNELVSRYIKIRTGKIRTRKQVSSHLQVLTKRRSKELQLLRQDKEAQLMIWNRLKNFSSSSNEKRSNNMEQCRTHASDNFHQLSITSLSTDDSEPNISPVSNLIQSLRTNQLENHMSYSPAETDASTLVDFDLPACIGDNSMACSTDFPIAPLTDIKSDATNSEVNQCVLSYLFPESPPFSSDSTDQSGFLSDDGSCSLPLSSFPGLISIHPVHSTAQIGNETFRLYDLSAFIELKRTLPLSSSHPFAEMSSIHQHDLVRLHANDIQMQKFHAFETISIDQISDKFPDFDGLKDLFGKNPGRPFFLVKFWTDISFAFSPISQPIYNKDETFYTSYTYASSLYQPIQISTRLCSFGKQVLEKMEISEHPQRDQFNQFIHRFDRSPLCDYMTHFIQKLRSLPNASVMNSVLENFTVLQVIRSRDTKETLLLCLAFVFEVAMLGSSGSKYQVYKLVND